MTEQRRLRLMNITAGAIHAGQGLAVLALANEFSLPVTGAFMDGPPGTQPPPPVVLFEFPFAWGVAGFLFLSAFAHWAVAAPGVYPWYLANLSRSRNYARWIEYSLSSTLMMVLIALLVGISDGAALGAIAGANASMILFETIPRCATRAIPRTFRDSATDGPSMTTSASGWKNP